MLRRDRFWLLDFTKEICGLLMMCEKRNDLQGKPGYQMQNRHCYVFCVHTLQGVAPKIPIVLGCNRTGENRNCVPQARNLMVGNGKVVS